ncbi:MAG: hypothetical protein P1V97_07315 [Planctomycetota bacterium]|nr:hypothetical protein [Planctomycetota bacterium]
MTENTSAPVADEPEKRSSRGRWLVFAIFCFALPIGGGGLAARAFVRGIRGQRTYDGLVTQLKIDGYLKNEAPKKSPEVGTLDRLANGFKETEKPKAKDLALVLAAFPEFQKYSLKHRGESFRAFGRVYSKLSKNPSLLPAISSAANEKALLSLFTEAGLLVSLENEFHKQVGWLTRREADLREKHNFFIEVFPLAEAGDIRACYARILGTAMEASKLKHSEATLLAARAQKIADQQAIRISDQSLLIFPAVKELYDTEFKLRTQARMLASAMKLIRTHKNAPASFDGTAMDPIAGKALQYLRIDAKKARLSSPAGEHLDVHFP